MNTIPEDTESPRIYDKLKEISSLLSQFCDSKQIGQCNIMNELINVFLKR